MPLRGEDHGSFLAPGHIVARLNLDERDLTLTPLSYDWFSRSLKRGGVPAALKAAVGERGQVVLSGAAPALSRWLSARGPSDPAFGAAAVFSKQ